MAGQLRSSAVARVIELAIREMPKMAYPVFILILATCMAQMGLGAPNFKMVNRLKTHFIVFNESDYAQKENYKRLTGVVVRDLRYKIVDEFGKEATVLHEGGMLYILNCTEPKYLDQNVKEHPLSSPNITISKGLDAITFEIQGAKNATVKCANGSTRPKNMPTGSIPRVAGKGKCQNHRDDLDCGLEEHEAKRICWINESGNGPYPMRECSQVYTDNLYDKRHVHLAYTLETNCSLVVKFQYKTIDGADVDIIPGIVVALEEANARMTVYVKAGATLNDLKITSIQCNITGQDPKNNKEEITIDVQSISRVAKGLLARVDCHAGNGHASTYFFIGIKSVQVECPMEYGQSAMCKVASWIELAVPVTGTKAQEVDGYKTCSLTVELCFPMFEEVFLMASKKCPVLHQWLTSTNADHYPTPHLEGPSSNEESGSSDSVGMIAGIVCGGIMLVVLVCEIGFFVYNKLNAADEKTSEKVLDRPKFNSKLRLKPKDKTASEWDLKQERETTEVSCKRTLQEDDTLFGIPSLVQSPEVFHGQSPSQRGSFVSSSQNLKTVASCEDTEVTDSPT